MLHRMRGLGIAGGGSIAAWVGAVCVALFGLGAGAAQAQTVTEFSAGISTDGSLESITAEIGRAHV